MFFGIAFSNSWGFVVVVAAGLNTPSLDYLFDDSFIEDIINSFIYLNFNYIQFIEQFYSSTFDFINLKHPRYISQLHASIQVNAIKRFIIFGRRSQINLDFKSCLYLNQFTKLVIIILNP